MAEAAEAPVSLHGLTCEQVAQLAKERLPRGAGRARSIYRRVMKHGVFAPEDEGLGPVAIEAWRAHFAYELPEVANVIDEQGQTGTTAKAVLRLRDGYEIECVLIPMGRGRHTLCVSSQVGCKMGCEFCETARMGLLRHLSAAEIVAQLQVARHVLGWEFRNVVFMGMGEALDNAALVPALRVLNDSAGMAMAQERLTVCTVGDVDGITRLAAAGFKRLNLSISLNAADDETRSRIMPVNRRYPLAELQAALVAYRPRRNFALGVNYCLMPGINDSAASALAVARFCQPLERVLVNVIPYNPGNVPLTRAPTDDEVDTFIGWLKAEGLAVRRRITKGRSVMAACGQLGNADLRGKRRLPVG